MIPPNEAPKVVNFTETEGSIVVIRDYGDRRMGPSCLVGTEFPLEKVVKMDDGDNCTVL